VLVASIGQICLRKGQTLLAQAAVSLAQAFPKVNYLLVGERYSRKQESVAYENRIRLIFRKGAIKDRLFCLGFRDDVPQLLNEIDLLVHAAHQEPLGRVLLEAAACGRAMVATDVGGTTEILSDGESALLIPPNNVNALTNAMRQLLQDCGLRHRLGRQARQQVLEKFTISPVASQTRAFWESLR
jgi:glycosyltransferase involved in cell wall biosynthesis